MDNKKEVIFYTPGLYPCKTGGLEIYNYHLIKNISKKQTEISWTILTGCKLLVSKNRNYYPLKNRIFLLRRWGLGSLSTILYYSVSKKIKWSKEKTIVIPYSSDFQYNALAFLLLNIIFQVSYVIHIHDGNMAPRKPYWLEKLFFARAERIAGVSKPISDEYTRRCGREVEYLPPLLPFKKAKNPKEQIKIEKGFERFNKIILFCGTLKPLKCPDILLQAFHILGKEFIAKENVGLVFVGDGPMKDSLKDYSIESNLDNYIFFAGKVANEKVSEYYEVADFFVIPSWFEGTPIALLEAMYNGLLCIGSDVTGIADIIDNNSNGILFEKNDYKSLSRIIKTCLLDEKHCEKFGNNAYNHFQTNFNYDSHLNLVREFLLN